MNPTGIGKRAQIFVQVPRTFFYAFVYPKLSKVRHWVAHYGDWARQTYRHRLIGDVNTISDLRNIFGDLFVGPLTCAEIGGYNDDLTKGELCGHMLFLDYEKGFKLSYNHDKQRLKFVFDYIVYRWNEENGRRVLDPQNRNASEVGVDTKGFPVEGLRVKVFWVLWQSWHVATVHRWSINQGKWVLKYDEWADTVYEDVSPLDWKFVDTLQLNN